MIRDEAHALRIFIASAADRDRATELREIAGVASNHPPPARHFGQPTAVKQADVAAL